MTSASDLENQLTCLLNNAAKKLNFESFTLNLNLDAQIGDGFMGEFYKVSITNDETNETVHLAVKKAPVDEVYRTQNCAESMYQNEILFYSQIIPTLQSFEKEHQIEKYFASIPQYITSVSELGHEMIVLKDITKQGFALREKDLVLDDEHARLIFKTYGHFHALSFCLKEQKPDEFARITKSINNVWLKFSDSKIFLGMIKGLTEVAREGLDPDLDGAVTKNLQKYIDNIYDIYTQSLDYKGQYSGIVHGDCWSNNMMFKYQDSKNKSVVEDINLLDFQIVFVGTPIYDLSYFFYTGGSKELFDNLESYLDIYHESFSKAARNLGCVPNKLLPRQALTNDWKIYSRLGLLLSILLIKIKLTRKEDTIKMIENGHNNKENVTDEGAVEGFLKVKYDKASFQKRTRDILVHMNGLGAL